MVKTLTRSSKSGKLFSKMSFSKMIDTSYKQNKRWAGFIRYGRQEHRKKFYCRFPLNATGMEPQFLPREVFRNDIPSAKGEPKNLSSKVLNSAMEGLSLIPVLRMLTVFWTRFFISG